MFSRAREGVIIECPMNDLFHSVVIVIITSRTAVSELIDNDNDKAWPSVEINYNDDDEVHSGSIITPYLGPGDTVKKKHTDINCTILNCVIENKTKREQITSSGGHFWPT